MTAANASGGAFIVGDLMVDVVVSIDGAINLGSDTSARISLVGGGSAANTACWLAAAGTRARLAAGISADNAGTGAVVVLQRHGVEYAGPMVPDTTTGTCVVVVHPDGERTMFPDRGANDHLDRFDFAPLRDDPPARIHISGYALLGAGSRQAALGAIQLGRDLSIPVSVDAASAAPLAAAGADRFLGWIEGVDEVFANEDEADALGGIDAILGSCRSVIAKRGARGAEWTDGTRRHHVDARPVTAVDTTGAGDAFAAGWLDAALRGEDIPGRLGAAADRAALAVSVVGARPELDPIGL